MMQTGASGAATASKIEVILPNGSLFPCPKTLASGEPVKRSIRDFLLWLSEKIKFDLSKISAKNELGEAVNPFLYRVDDYPFQRLVLSHTVQPIQEPRPVRDVQDGYTEPLTKQTSSQPPPITAPLIPMVEEAEISRNAAAATRTDLKPSSELNPAASSQRTQTRAVNPVQRSTFQIGRRTTMDDPVKQKQSATSASTSQPAGQVTTMLASRTTPPNSRPGSDHPPDQSKVPKKSNEAIDTPSKPIPSTLSDLPDQEGEKSVRGSPGQSKSNVVVESGAVPKVPSTGFPAMDVTPGTPSRNRSSGVRLPPAAPSAPVPPPEADDKPQLFLLADSSDAVMIDMDDTENEMLSSTGGKGGYLLPLGSKMNIEYEVSDEKKRSDLTGYRFELDESLVLFVEEQRSRGDTFDAVALARSLAPRGESPVKIEPTVTAVPASKLDQYAQEFLLQLYERLRDPTYGVDVKSRKFPVLGSAKKIFTNKDLVDWLIKEDAKSRTEAVQICEALQLCNMIAPKNKGQAFADDYSSSRFNSPDDFIFSDSATMQNMFVHLSRSSSKLQQRSSSGNASTSGFSTVSSAPLKTKNPRRSSGIRVSGEDLNDEPRGRRNPSEEDDLTPKKRERSPNRVVDFSVPTSVSVYEHQLTFEMQRAVGTKQAGITIKKIVLPWATVDSIFKRTDSSSTHHYIEISSWDMRRVCIALAGGEDEVQDVVANFTKILNAYHDSSITHTLFEPTMINFLSDPILDLSSEGNPLSNSFWKTSKKHRGSLGNFRDRVVPKIADDSELKRMSLSWNGGDYPSVSWAKSNPEKSSRFGGVLLRSGRPNGFTDSVSQVKFSTMAALLNATDIAQALEYTFDIHSATIDSKSELSESLRLFVLDTGLKCEPLAECFEPLCTFTFVGCPSSESLEQIYRKLRKAATPYLRVFGPFFFNIDTCGYVAAMKLYLDAAVEVVQRLQAGLPVLIMDGSNAGFNAAIISSLAQIIIDPRYRTVEGFTALFCKEWMKIPRPTTQLSDGPWIELFMFLSCCSSLYHHNFGSFQFSGLALFIRKLSNSNNYSKLSATGQTASSTLSPCVHSIIPWFDYLLNFNMGVSNLRDKVKSDLLAVSNESAPSFKAKNVVSLPDIVIPQMVSLSLYDGNIWTLPDAFAKFANLSSLVLDSNRLTVLPPVVMELTSLISISINKNKLAYLPDLHRLVNLKSLHANRNQLISIAGICNNVNLVTLLLDSNQLKSIPTEMKNLKNLSKLDLSQNKLSFISGRTLSEMKSLAFLSLSSNELVVAPSALPPNLEELHLEALHEYVNKISALPQGLLSCENLTHLDASSNAIEVVPEEIGKLKNLKVISLRQNNIESLPLQLTKCRFLERLVLSKNRISDVPLWFYQLRGLKTLDLEDNRIEKISSSFGQMKALNTLNLANNQITATPLPLGLLAGTLAVLNMGGNKMNPEVMLEYEKGTSSFLAYLKSKLSEDFALYRVNLMFVGAEKAGKTHLFNTMCNLWDVSEDEGSRGRVLFEGVDVKTRIFDIDDSRSFASRLLAMRANAGTIRLRKTRDESPNPLTRSNTKRLTSEDLLSNSPKVQSILNVDSKRPRAIVTLWDFAGQDIFHALDRYFFVKSSVYLLVVDLTDPSIDASTTYWFNTVQSQVSHPTVIIIGTHKDETKDSKPASTLDKIAKRLQASNPKSNITSIAIDSNEDIDCESLLSHIQSTLTKFTDFGRKVPANFLFFESLLKDYVATLDYPLINYQLLMRLGDACGLGKQKDVLNCTKFLHDLGSILYFDDVLALKDLVIIDPLWLYGVMSTVFGKESAVLRNGIASNLALSQVYRRFDPKLHAHLRNLLMKFEVAFEIQGDVEALSALIQSTSREATVAAGATQLLSASRPLPDSSVFHFNKSSSLRQAKARNNDMNSNRSDRNVKSAALDLNSSNALLVSSLLPSTQPTYLIKQLWVYPPRQTTIHHDRLFIFDFLPPGLFPSILVRCLNNAEALNNLWRNGVLGIFEYNSCSAKVYLSQTFSKLINGFQLDTNVPSVHYNTIRLEVRGGDATDVREVFTALIDIISSIMSEFRKLSFTQYVLNPQTFTNQYFTVLPLDNIEAAIRRGDSRIISDSGDVPYDIICPDITIAAYKGPRVKIDQFNMQGDLGEGGFAKVKKGTYLSKPVAVKVIKLPSASDATNLKNSKLAEFRREILAQTTFHHTNIVSVVAICMTPLAMALDFCPLGDLNKYLHKHDSTYSWVFALKVAREVCSAVHYMQTLDPPWAHLDLKTPNILLKSSDPNDKICASLTDFGTSRRANEPFTVRYVDNPTWLAPEILQGLPYDQKSDTYALGVILWELITRAAFFGEIQWEGEKQDRVIAGERPVIPPNCPPEYKFCIEQCWAQEADRRPSLDKIDVELAKLLPSVQSLETSCPIPVPPEIKDDLIVPDDIKHLVHQDLYPEVSRIIIWIDDRFEVNTNAVTAFQIRREFPKIMFLNFKSLNEFIAWFEKEGVHLVHKLKIVTGGYRKDDGEENAAEMVLMNVQSDYRKSQIPLMVFVGQMRANVQALAKRGATVTADALQFRKYCIEGL